MDATDKISISQLAWLAQCPPEVQQWGKAMPPNLAPWAATISTGRIEQAAIEMGAPPNIVTWLGQMPSALLWAWMQREPS